MDWQRHFAEISRRAEIAREPSRFGAAVLQADDIDAINRYIVYTKINTKEAAAIHDEWVRWHDDLSWWEKNMDSATYDKARNLRNRFNLANAKTEKERQDVKNVMQTGLTSEELQGGARRTLASGMYEEESPPLIATSVKVTAGVVIATGLLGYVAYKMYVPDFGRLKKLM